MKKQFWATLGIAALLLGALPVHAQFGAIFQGTPTGACPSTPILEFDSTNIALYICKNGTHKVASSTAVGTAFVFPASTTAHASYTETPGPAPTTIAQGADYFDSTQQTQVFGEVSGAPVYKGGVLYQLAAAGTSTVIDTAATLNGSAYSIPAGTLNVVGKKIRIKGWGTYSITTSTPTLALALKAGSVTLATCTSSATTNGATTFPFHYEFTLVVAAAGASGNDEAHCMLQVVLGASATAAASVFLDNNTAVSSNYDHTAAVATTIVGTAAGASNAALLRDETVEILK